MNDDKKIRITLKDTEELQKALEVGGQNSDIAGGVLQVEPLPGWMFNGNPTKIKEKSTGKEYEVQCSGYEKEINGIEVTIKKGGKFIHLSPDEYEVTERHSEPSPLVYSAEMVRENYIVKQIKEIKQAIEGVSYNLADEKEMQEAMYENLKELGFVREYRLQKGQIIDFYRESDGIGIEVKVKGQVTAIFRQCKKYCKNEKISIFILVTAKSMGFPVEIEGKSCYYISISKSML